MDVLQLKSQLARLWGHNTTPTLCLFARYLTAQQRLVLLNGINQTAAAKLQPNVDKKQYLSLINILVGDIQETVCEAASAPQPWERIGPFVRTTLNPGGVHPPNAAAADSMCAALGRFLGAPEEEAHSEELLYMVIEFRTAYCVRVLELLTRQLVRIEKCQGRAESVAKYVTVQQRPSRSEEVVC